MPVLHYNTGKTDHVMFSSGSLCLQTVPSPASLNLSSVSTVRQSHCEQQHPLILFNDLLCLYNHPDQCRPGCLFLCLKNNNFMSSIYLNQWDTGYLSLLTMWWVVSSWTIIGNYELITANIRWLQTRLLAS